MAQKVTAYDEQRLLDFVRTKVDSFIKWELVRFFHDNPYAADTADNIARFAGREPRFIEVGLEELVTSGLVEASTPGTVRVYRYTKDQDARDLIASFVLACDDRDFRMRATNLVIEGLQ
jgi:hypothetical protein